MPVQKVKNGFQKIQTWLIKDGYKLIPICVLLLVACFYLIFLTAKEVALLKTDGKAIIGDTIIETFLAGNEQDAVELASFSAYDNLYENRGRIYLSNNQEISSVYPLYINDNLSIMNINQNNKLITTDYIEEEGYPYFTLSNGILYNDQDLEQASYETYLFLKLSNGLYINSIPITVQTVNETIDIPFNSILYIEEKGIQYYVPSKDTFVYHGIEGMDDTTSIQYQETEITFQNLLDNLHITTVEDIPTPTPTATPTPIPTPTPSAEEVQIEPPTIQFANITEGVYGFNGELSSTGDTSYITKAITFIVKKSGNVVLRKQFVNFGNIRISGLEPGETYEVEGTYSYQLPDEEEVTETFYKGSVTLKDVDTLGTIELSFENGLIYPNKIELQKLKILDSSDQEALNGMTRAVIRIDGEEYTINSRLLTQLRNGEEVIYQSPEMLNSNETLDYEIVITDSYDNELKVVGNTGSTRTSKQVPKVTISTLKNEVNDLQLQIKLDNKDNVTIENYHYVIYNSSGTVFQTDVVPEDGILKLNNMNSQDWYQMIVYGT